MFEDLSEKLEATFARLRGRGVLTEADIREGLREVRRVLLEADVNFQLTREFLERVEKKATGVNALTTVSPGQQLVKIVHEELTAMLGERREGLKLGTVPPSVVMMVGLQGSGKTTTAAKLARKLKAEGRSTRLVAADVYRPAAIDQLETLGRELSIPVYADRTTTDVVKIARAGVAEALRERDRVVIIDTAGRLQIDDAMMQELSRLKEALRPSEILLVADGMTGQDAVKIAQGFDQVLDITGVVLTKMDGDARGGAALSIRNVTGLPIAFIGTGERTDGLEPFHPDRLAQRILGMGDILSLVERAQETVDQAEAERVAQRLMDSRFTLDDFRSQLAQVKKMGPIGQLLGMIPGAGQLAGAAQQAVDDGQLKRIEAIIDSMTAGERRHPELIKASRRRRIAAGSGTTPADVNRLLKQFSEMQRLMRQLGSGRLPRSAGGLRSILGG